MKAAPRASADMDNGLDEDGYIRPEATAMTLMAAYKPVLSETTACLLTAFPSRLHSLYVYGSVARGNAVQGESDLDILAVFHSQPTEDEKNELLRLEQELSAKFSPSLREVGVAVSDLGEVTGAANLYGWTAFITIFCFCLWGDDLTEQFWRFKPTPDLAVGFNGDISKSLEDYRKRLTSEQGVDNLLRLCSQMSRKLIRASYSMVMARSGTFTSDLRKQASLFSDYFPERREAVSALVEFSSRPTSDKQLLFDLLNNYGKWLSANFTVEASKTGG